MPAPCCRSAPGPRAAAAGRRPRRTRAGRCTAERSAEGGRLRSRPRRSSPRMFAAPSQNRPGAAIAVATACGPGPGSVRLVLRAILLFLIAFAGPWVVQLAPPRQRLMALVGFVGVLLLWLVFSSWVDKWYFWLGLLLGIGSVVFVARSGGQGRGRGGGQGRGRGGRSRRPPAHADLTEEL